MTISCGEDRGDKAFWEEGFTETAGGVDIEPDAVRAAGGGLAAETGVVVFDAAEWDAVFFAMVPNKAICWKILAYSIFLSTRRTLARRATMVQYPRQLE